MGIKALISNLCKSKENAIYNILQSLYTTTNNKILFVLVRYLWTKDNPYKVEFVKGHVCLIKESPS